MRTGLKIGLACALVVTVGGAASFGPLVRSRAMERAKRLGVELDVGAVRPGWGRLWLRDVSVRLPAVPAVRVRITSVEVRLSASLSVAGVTAHGGRVQIEGAPAELAKQLGAWRAQHHAGPAGSGKAAPVAADGLYVDWQGVLDGAGSAQLWGFAYARRPSGDERLSADLARATWISGSVQAAGGVVALERKDGHRWVDHLAAGSLSLALDLDSKRLRRALGSARTVARPAAERPGARLSPERGPHLRASLGRMASAVRAVLRPGGALDIDGLRIRLRHGAQTLNVGPGRLHVARDSEQVALALSPGSAVQKAPITLRLSVPFDEKPVDALVEGGPVSLASLGVQPGDLGLTRLDRSTIAARATLKLAANGQSLSFTGDGRLANLSIDKRWLSSEPVTGLVLGWRGSGELGLDGGHLRLDDSELDVGKVRLVAKGSIERGEDFTRLSLEGGVPLASCQDMLDSSPDGLTPLLTGMHASGTFSLEGRVELDTRHPDNMLTRWTVANECRITAVPSAISPRRFQQPWTRVVKGADKKPMTIASGPGTPTWVPRYAISKHMETGLLVCEDAGFWRHHGFDEEAIRNSIRDNVKAGHFIRGASTLSMQLAKNLYLSHKKVLSRKLEEAVLTMLLEQELTKDQILELYLNVVEFGPGIYGIGPAARYYFNTTPDRLSLGQSLYIASILPNPRVQHFGADGKVTPGWSSYLRKLMHIAYRIHRISDDELDAGLDEQVTFGVPYTPTQPSDQASAANTEPVHDDAVFGNP